MPGWFITDEGRCYKLWVSTSVRRSHTRLTQPCSAALAAATAPDPVTGLYTDNSSEPLGEHAGLRNFYNFGLYSYCAYVDASQGACSKHVTANKLQPYEAFLGDIPTNYTGLTNSFIPTTTFIDSQYLGEFSRGAYYLLLLGSIATALALFTSVFSRFLDVCSTHKHHSSVASSNTH